MRSWHSWPWPWLPRVPSAVRWARRPCWPRPKTTNRRRHKLPPLTIEDDARCCWTKAQDHSQRQAGGTSVAENTACYVCHVNFQDEELVTQHAVGDTGCVDCHGKSYPHRNDENNTTPPDIMIPREKIEASCLKCHETHNAPAAKVIARLQERLPRIPSSAQPLLCTDCHGFHRLAHRTVVWNRATGELLTRKTDQPAAASSRSLEAIKALAGTWVQADENRANRRTRSSPSTA